MHLSRLTTVEARDLLNSPNAVGLLPLGAIEAHGPHLPLETDVLLSGELAERVAAALPPTVAPVLLPPLSLAVTEYARHFAGTISLRPETAAAVLGDVLDSLGKHGLSRVALINSHLEPAHVAIIESALSAPREQPRLLFANHCRKPWALALSDEFKSGDCHAGSYETSLLLASRHAGCVRLNIARSLPPANHGLVAKMRAGARTFAEMGATESYFGNPASASAAEGEQMWAVLTDMWVVTISASM